MSDFCRAGLIGLLFTSAPSLAIAPTATTQSFLDQHLGLRAMIHGERLTALYGVPLATKTDSSTTDQFVQTFLNQHKNALGVDNVELVLRDQITIANGKYTVYTYTQRIEGRHVQGSILKIVVLLTAPQKIVYAGMHLVDPPASPLPEDLISEATACTGFSNVSAAEKVIVEDGAGDLHRAWRFTAADEEESSLIFVDTHTGAIVAALDAGMNGTVNVTVNGKATPGLAADSPSNPPQTTALGDVEVRLYAGNSPCPPGESENPLSSDFTNSAGTFAFSTSSFPDRATARLVGRWVEVADCTDNLMVCVNRVRDNLLEPGVVCSGVDDPDENGAGAATLPFNSQPTEFGTAAVNAFLVVEATHDWFSALVPSFEGINYRIPCTVNGSVPNGHYDFLSQSLYLGRSSSALSPSTRNWAYSTVTSHEYGHFILDRVLPYITDLTDPNRDDFAAMNEGVADTVASLKWQTSVIGKDYYASTPPSPLRDLDTPDYRLHACTSNVYCRAAPLPGAFWDTRKRLIIRYTSENHATPEADAQSAVERLFADFLFITDGLLDESVVVEVLIADDDDGDLSTASPHQQEIHDSFIGMGHCSNNSAQECAQNGDCGTGNTCVTADHHGWPEPMVQPNTSGIVVAWNPPTADGRPSEDVDYTINYYVSPPAVILKSTENSNGLAIQSWSIGRVSAGSPNDIGTIKGSWTGTPHDVEILVGVDAARPCRNVNVIDVLAPMESGTQTKYSSVRLNLTGDVISRVQAYPATAGTNAGQGGRLSGTVSGKAGRAYGKAIGARAQDLGSLKITGAIDKLQLDSLPADPQPNEPALEVGGIPYRADLTGQLNGTLRVHGDLAATGDFTVNGTGESNGSIRVDGNITTSIAIAGTMNGDIIADYEQNGVGAITGVVAIPGTFNGNICGTNLHDWPNTLPSNIQIAHFGPNARICGAYACEGRLQVEPAAIAKNRYLSFVVPEPPAQSTTAIRVTLKSLQHPDPPNLPQFPAPNFTAFETQARYVGAVNDCVETESPPTTFRCAKLQCEPLHTIWPGDGNVIHVYGSEIVPSSTYEVQRIPESSCTYLTNGLCCSESTPLTITTQRWGDVVTPFQQPSPAPLTQPNIGDINAVVDKWRGVSAAPIIARVDLIPNMPDRKVQIPDIAWTIDAFRSFAYPYAGPTSCP